MRKKGSGHTLGEHGELLYGLAVAVDIENFSKHDTLDQYELQGALGMALDAASKRAGLDRETWYRQARGDGELSILPADVDVARVVAHLSHELTSALREMRTANDPPRLRLRVAMHHGTLTRGRFGPVGQAPIVVCRLLDARAVRHTLAEKLDMDLVLVVSSTLYHEVVQTRFYGLNPALFKPHRIKAKGTTYTAYITTEPFFLRNLCQIPSDHLAATSLTTRLLESN